MVNRVTNFSLIQNTFRNISTTQSTLADLQRQISSGVKAENFQGLHSQVEQFTFLESKLRQTERYQENNTITLARLRTADNALGQVVDKVDEMENLMVQRRNGALAGEINFEQQLRDMIKSVASEMNVSFEGRYLFGGTETGIPPIEDPLVRPTTVGVPDDSYYTGSKQSTTYRADERQEFTFPVRADDEAFQQIFAAYNLAIEGHRENDDDKIIRAMAFIQRGQEELNVHRGSLNSSVVALEQINDRHGQMKKYWKGVTEEVGKTDIVAASIEVANAQSILQASFQAFARISQLKLSDFLR